MEKSMSVQVKQSHIRKSASFLSPVLGVLAYGDRVSVVGEDNPDWIMVKADAGSGFVHSSALTAKEVILNPGAKDVEKAASSDEIALAGKGFNDQVEGAFRAKNPHLNFAAVDRMEGYKVSENQMRNFLIQGRIFPKEGQS
ncbi:MAG: SH3 domain-containing protein [Desulfobacterales bacterium]|nr:SH3 domain-containing protein [Desulfobacterales bacterium]